MLSVCIVGQPCSTHAFQVSTNHVIIAVLQRNRAIEVREKDELWVLEWKAQCRELFCANHLDSIFQFHKAGENFN